MGRNFIEYAAAVNMDRSIPDAKSGLKPVAKRAIYCAFDNGYTSSKPHVKCASIVGQTIADWHPHGDSSVYGTIVRLSQKWVMRYPLIDWHGNNGNIAGDPPAHYRYTEARLAKLTEEGLLTGIKKKNVDFIPNFSETKDEPITLPSIFPNLLCNPNTGIGVAIACNWLPHNLKEVAQAIYDYLDGKEPMLPGPDFPTGGLVLNKEDIPAIMRTGHGSVKLRGKYNIEDNNKIIFYEIPYGINTETLLTQIGEACDTEKITGINDIRDESNRKGLRITIQCEKNANLKHILNQLFKETDLQTSISYNQVALVDKTPTELNLKDCVKIYVDHNCECITREVLFDMNKAKEKLHIVLGLIKALDIIDEIIAMIKTSPSAADAKNTLIDKWGFTDVQAQAIMDMKLSKLARLEKENLETEKKELEDLIEKLKAIYNDPISELRIRLGKIVEKYGDERKTELTQITETKEDKEIVNVEPEKCVVVMTEGGLIKRVPSSSFKIQKKNGIGVKTQDDITNCVIRTNTVDSLMVFTSYGKMYRLLVDDIPVGTNTTKGVPISSLIKLENKEKPSIIYSIYRDTDAKYVCFITEQGIIKKSLLEEYTKTKRAGGGIAAMTLRNNDKLASVFLLNEEDIIITTELGMSIRFSSKEVTPTSRTTMGVKAITLGENDKVAFGLPIRDNTDNLALFSINGLGKQIKLPELQRRGGKGQIQFKVQENITGRISCGSMVNDQDSLLVVGDKNSICIKASEIPLLTKQAVGNKIIKNSKILSVSKI